MSGDLLIDWEFTKAVAFLADRATHGMSPTGALSDSLRRKQTSEITTVKDSLMTIRTRELTPAKLMLEDAFCFYVDPACRESALWHFKKAASLAWEAISTAPDARAKIEATSIATVGALFANEENTEQACTLCKRYVEKLHSCAEVQQVFKAKMNRSFKNKVRGMFTKKKRQQILQTICTVNFTLFRYFCKVGVISNLKQWPTVSMPGSDVIQPVTQMLSVAEKATGKVPMKGTVSEMIDAGHRVVCVDDTGKELQVWDADSMRSGGSFQRWFPLASTIVDGVLITVSEPLAVGQQSFVSTLDLLDFCQLERYKLPGGTKYLHVTVTDTSVAIIDNKGRITHLNPNDFTLQKQVRIHFPRKTDLESDRITLVRTQSAVDSRCLYWWDVETASLFKFNLFDGRKVKEVSSHAQVGLLTNHYLCAVELKGQFVSALEVRSTEDLTVVFKNDCLLKTSRQIACERFCCVSEGLLAVLYQSRRSYWLTVWELTSGAQLWEQFFGGGRLSAPIVGLSWFKADFLLVVQSDGNIIRYKVCGNWTAGRKMSTSYIIRGAASLFNLATPGSPVPITPGQKSRSMSNLLDY